MLQFWNSLCNFFFCIHCVLYMLPGFLEWREQFRVEHFFFFYTREDYLEIRIPTIKILTIGLLWINLHNSQDSIVRSSVELHVNTMHSAQIFYQVFTFVWSILEFFNTIDDHLRLLTILNFMNGWDKPLEIG